MYDIITIGTVTQDAFLKSPYFKVIKSPDFITGQAECFALGSKIEIPEVNFTSGGGAANAAITFSRQGFKVACLAKVGEDFAGEGIRKILIKEKIGAEFLQLDKKKPTAFSVVLMAKGGERTILVSRGASEHLEINSASLNHLKTKWFYFAPMSGNNIKLIKPIIDFARKHNIKIAMNPSSTFIKLGLNKVSSILKNIDVLIINKEEGAILTDIDYNKEKEIFSALDKVIDGIVVMTKGNEGAMISDGEYLYKAGVYKRGKAVDRTGAGDAFGSGFVSGLIKTGNIERAISLGSANGTSVVEHIGAQSGILTSSQFKKKFKELNIEKIKI